MSNSRSIPAGWEDNPKNVRANRRHWKHDVLDPSLGEYAVVHLSHKGRLFQSAPYLDSSQDAATVASHTLGRWAKVFAPAPAFELIREYTRHPDHEKLTAITRFRHYKLASDTTEPVKHLDQSFFLQAVDQN